MGATSYCHVTRLVFQSMSVLPTMRLCVNCGCGASRSGGPGCALPRLPAGLPGSPDECVLFGRGDDLVIEVRYLREMIDGVPVMATPPEIDVTTAEQLRAVLLAATENRYRTLVVDMTRTRFCDSSGFSVLVAAHQRALAEGGGLRLVIPDGSRVLRIFTVIGLGRFIPRFASLDQAQPAAPAAAAD